MRVKLLHSICACTIAVAATVSPKAVRAHAQQDPPGELSLRLSGDVDLVKLVELVSERLGVSVQYQAQDLAKRVTLRLRDPLTDAELWSVLASALESQGLVVAPTGAPGVYRVTTLQQALAQGVPLDDHARAGADDVNRARDAFASVVATVVRVRHLDAARAAEAIKPTLSQQAVARPVGDGSNLLLLADARSRVEQALALLARIDVPPTAPELPGAAALERRVVTLEHVTASQAAELALRVLSAERAALTPTSVSPVGIAARAAASVSGAQGSSTTTQGVVEVAPGVQLVALPGESRLLVLASSASNADRVVALLGELDAPSPVETRSYAPPAPGVRAEDLATTLRELLALPNLRGGRGASPGGAGSGAGSGGGGGSGGGAASGGGGVYADALTGTVFVTGTARDHARVEALLAQLRDAPPGSLREMRSFTIRNRDAAELLATLEALVGMSGETAPRGVRSTMASAPQTPASALPTSPPSSVLGSAPRSEAAADAALSIAGGAPSGGGAASGGGSGGESGGAEVLGGITLSVDAPTNTILASGGRAALDELARLIERLDRRQPQVLLEVQLISLSRSDALDVGVELRTMFRAGDTRVNLSSLFGLASGTDALPTGTGLTGLVVNPGDFEVLVRALEQVNRGRALSSPKVLVANNATTTLRSVNRQPFTSINASDTVATTSFGGTQDAGTTLTVTPRIAEGDHLTLEYSVELSAFTGEPTTTAEGGVIPPPSQQSSVQGQVTIPDGYTVALGGLRDVNESEGTTRVPILGSLPIIGQLFRVDSESNADARFYVFIRATVLRDAGFADLRALSAPEIAQAGAREGEPALNPIWIDGKRGGGVRSAEPGAELREGAWR